MASSNGNAALTAEDGFVLGVEMVREMQDTGCELDQFMIEQHYRPPGVAQHNLVAKYLARVRSLENAEVERGFTAFLTEYIASCAGGGVPDLDLYDIVVETEVI